MPCSKARNVRKRSSALIDETYADPVQLQSAAGVASLKRARLSTDSNASQSQVETPNVESQPVAGPSNAGDKENTSEDSQNAEEPREIIYINSWKDVPMEDDENDVSPFVYIGTWFVVLIFDILRTENILCSASVSLHGLILNV